MKHLLELSTDRVDLWFTPLDKPHDDALLARYQTLLTPEEQQRHCRFYFLKDRHRYLITRALVRHVLSQYLPVRPGGWLFKADRYGKPMIADAIGLAKRISFNISHTEGLVIMGVSLDRALGVDAESLRRQAFLDLANLFFSPTESASLRQLPPPSQALRFLELWTLKESYIKARGMGLSLPLDKFSFQLADEQHIAVEFDVDFGDTPSRWRFWQLRPTGDHLVAVCVEAERGASVALTARHAIPLSHERITDSPIVRDAAMEQRCSRV